MTSTFEKKQGSKFQYAYIDAHADTIIAAMEVGANLNENDLHVDFTRLKKYGSPVVQVLPIFVHEQHLTNAFEHTNAAIDFLEKELNTYSDVAALALSIEDIERNSQSDKISVILALEGGESLEGKIENLYHLYKRGVRLITLTWSRENELGYGVLIGSNKGLKPFGIEVVKKMNELGIIIDVSHLNDEGFWDVQKHSTRAVMASHSNAYTITPHERNLKDEQIKALVDTKGVVGLNLVPSFLSTDGEADIDSIVKHIRHFEKLGALSIFGMGCDFDGTGKLPKGINCVSCVKKLAARFEEEFGQDTAASIMSGNMYEFLRREFR